VKTTNSVYFWKIYVVIRVGSAKFCLGLIGGLIKHGIDQATGLINPSLVQTEPNPMLVRYNPPQYINISLIEKCQHDQYLYIYFQKGKKTYEKIKNRIQQQQS
jgi:hypothetical protein